VLAFLPFGILAFCVRRRRRLSKALWMLIAIAAVSAGMSGCGGNQVDFYTAVPTGPQTVTVTAAYTYVSTAPTEPAVSRSYVMPININ
jgi:ABC-type Mn2+/Zn2+ transport system permease subunit